MQPSSGAVTHTGTTLTYSPSLNYNGNDSITLTITDTVGNYTDTVQVTVTPVDDPTVVDNATLAADEDSVITIDLSTLILEEVDGDTLTYDVHQQGQLGSGNVPQGSSTLTYTPYENMNGTDTVKYLVNDGTSDAIATITINIAAINDAPDAIDFYGYGPEDITMLIDTTSFATDVDQGDTLNLTFLPSSNGGIAIDNQDGTMSYTPALGFSGIDQFDYVVTDQDGELDSATITLDIAPAPIIDMVSIAAGSFEMGDHAGVGGPEELPLHPVALSAFDMDRFEVSNQQFVDYLNRAFEMGQINVNGINVFQTGGAEKMICGLYYGITFDGVDTFSVDVALANSPAVYQTWYGAALYANWLSTSLGQIPCYDTTTFACYFAGNGFRLPTEAEWEYASRSGEQTPYFQYPWARDFATFGDANYFGNGIDTTTTVGSYAANSFGLHDMSGNVWEWCNDWYDANYYSVSAAADPTGPVSGTSKSFRGGSWFNESNHMRSAFRSGQSPLVRGTNLGFRLVATQ